MSVSNTLELREGWRLRSATQTPEGGETISTGAYSPDGWHPASVPTTVLNALVENGVYPDPRVGLNSFRIPDSSDEFNEQNSLSACSHLPDARNPWRDPYWYRTEFTLPQRAARYWLHLDALNYRADVWLNGTLVAGAQEVVGAFSRYRFDITDLAAADGVNCLAVKVHPVDHSGTPDTQLEIFGRPRSFHKEMMKDVTYVMSIGYDCMGTVPDRNMGLCDGVRVTWSGPVTIRDPFVRTSLPLPDTSPAALTVSAELTNASGRAVAGVLRGRIEGEVAFERPVSLAAGETQEVVVADLPVENPRLWWPNNYGAQELYDLTLSFEADGQLSDEQTVTFGIREVTTQMRELDGAHGRRVLVNGQKVFCRGGYVQPEFMFDWGEDRIEAEVGYLAHANLNMVYFEDTPNPPDAFLDACDRHGIMFGNCFYGCYWMQPGTEYPLDTALLSRSTVDLIKRYRNHPSLVMYMAMNEGETRQDVYEDWRRSIIEHDGTRFFIPSGSFPDYREDVPEWIRKDTPVGMNDYGPKSYGWQEPSTYYRWVREERNWMFMIESGSASLPALESLKRFIPDLGEAAQGAPFPLNATWAHHGANSYYKDYDAALRRLLGEPETVEDYVRKGQVVTADQHRAMFEAANHRMWDVTSGFTEWKLTSCWPSIQWQIYDWYLRPTVSYYYIRSACEPLHVQLGPLDSAVTVVNNRREPAAGLEVDATVYDMDMTVRWQGAERIDVGANTFRDVFTVPTVEDLSPIYFVHLCLEGAHGDVISRNLYWLCSGPQPDLRPLEQLPPVELNVSHEADGARFRVWVENPADDLAFFVHLALRNADSGEEALPVLWEDNYFCLLPGESRQVAAVCAGLAGAPAVVTVDGWNCGERG